MSGEPSESGNLFAHYALPIALGGASLVAIVISATILVKSTWTAAPIRFSASGDEASASGQAHTIAVDVEGAIANPGLYNLSDGSRVEDAITAAGGLTSSVDTAAFAKTVNRAMKLVDGGKIYIPAQGDAPNQNSTIQSPANGLVSVNTASASELDNLPGVGPVTAAKIISTRPYQTLEELVSKKAVGQALFEKIKDQISL